MNEAAIQNSELASLATPPPTSLAVALPELSLPAVTLQSHAGSLTPTLFSSTQQELTAAISTASVFDLGYRTRIRVTGPDRLRWLNGMVSNTIQSLADGHGNYNFILNAQGRIQGDAYIYRSADCLGIDTDRSQAARLFAHLDHFIIMDDVELQPLDEATTGIGVTGPKSAALLDALGLNASALAPLEFSPARIGDAPVTLVHAYSVLLPRFELWFDPIHTAAIWSALTAAGAEPSGIEAVESIRILDGTPRYGLDITDRHLAQETAQTRALNFTKGCYLGQEIVERIRSRATVHRTLRHFELEGSLPETPADLHLSGDATSIGQLTSVARLFTPQKALTLAIGFIRAEALERKLPIAYTGQANTTGTAAVLDRPPALPGI